MILDIFTSIMMIMEITSYRSIFNNNNKFQAYAIYGVFMNFFNKRFYRNYFLRLVIGSRMCFPWITFDLTLYNDDKYSPGDSSS